MRRPLCLTVALALTCLEIASGVALAQGAAPGVDAEPPVIELEALDEAVAGDSQVFTAQVADDVGLEDVRLYHRRAGDVPFASATMRPVGTSAFHSVTLPTDPDDLRDIEYYVQARDGGGNRSVAGFAFEPFVRTLSAPAPDAPLAGVPVTSVPADRRMDASTARAASDTGPSTGSRVRWWQVALGVVAVGSLAALAGGGDSDGGATPAGDGAPGGTTVPLTVNLGEPRR